MYLWHHWFDHGLTTGPISESWIDNFFGSITGSILKILFVILWELSPTINQWGYFYYLTFILFRLSK